jgi:hypothetical protein
VSVTKFLSEEFKQICYCFYSLEMWGPKDTNANSFNIYFSNFIKISLIIKECPEEILRKLAIVLKISKSS